MSLVRKHALPQWNAFTCGPAALRCALLCYGDRVDGRRLALLANTDKDGTDADGLRAAAAFFDLVIKHETITAPDVAALRIREHLREHKPILLCVDDWSHWVTAIPTGRFGSTKRHVHIADPARDEVEVIRRRTWRQLLRRAHYGLPDEIRWDLYVLELT